MGRSEHEAAVSLLLRIAVGTGRLDRLREGLHGIVSLFEIEQAQRVVDGHEQRLGPPPQRIVGRPGGQGLLGQNRRLGVAPDSLLQIACLDVRLGVGVPRRGTLAVRTVAVVVAHATVKELFACQGIARREFGKSHDQRPAGPIVPVEPFGIDPLEEPTCTVGMLRGQKSVHRELPRSSAASAPRGHECRKNENPTDDTSHFHTAFHPSHSTVRSLWKKPLTRVRYSGIFPSAPHLSSIPNNSEVVRPMSKPQASSDGRTSSGWRHGFPSGRVQVPSGQ